MNKEFIQALEDLERDKGVSKQLLLESIEVALLAAYKKNKGTTQNVHIEIDDETGEIEITYRKTVVDEVEDPESEIALEEVLQYDPDYVVGDVVEYPEPLENFGRIAAQTAKQVVVQRLREAERGMIYDAFMGRQSELVNGVIQRVSNDTVFVNLGRTEGILAKPEQVRGERYTVNRWRRCLKRAPCAGRSRSPSSTRPSTRPSARSCWTSSAARWGSSSWAARP